jgi:hypothetical protein
VFGNRNALHAQTTAPRPAVTIAHVSQLYRSIHVADVNEDGRPDLIGTTATGDLEIAPGHGDGTFDDPRAVGVRAVALAAGDFDADGHIDLVTDGIDILPGHGDGTFAAPRRVDTISTDFEEQVEPGAIAADFDDDGSLDLAVIDAGVVCVYPGRGDFTFGTRAELPATAYGALTLTAADFDGNGLPDIATAGDGNSVDVYLNQGSLLFSASAAAVAWEQWGIAAGDLNNDGHPDLVVARSGTAAPDGMGPGEVNVLLGDGTGAFHPPEAIATGVRGTVTVAIADFNHDGHADIATGNRSTPLTDTSCSGYTYWDSVTIVAGHGDGTFAEPASFRLDWLLDPPTYRNTHNHLATADLNGDGWPDLIASPGAVALAHAGSANRAPIASAGPDRTIVPGTGSVVLDGAAADVDFDWLDFEWRDASGTVIGPRGDTYPGVPHFCGPETPGTYTLTVTDRRGGTSTDSMTVYPALPADASLNVDYPRSGSVLGADTPFTIAWSQRNLTGVDHIRVSSSPDNGRSWIAVPGCESLPAGATSCTWHAPGPVSYFTRVQIEALDAGGSRVAFDASSRFRIVSGAAASLRSGWDHADVGAVGVAGSASDDGTTMTVAGSGADIWDAADEFHWAFTTMSGDFEAVVRVVSVDNVNHWTKAGLMVREGPGAGARHASVFVTPTTEKGIAFQRRPTASGQSISTAGPSITAPVWLRLVRTGHDVTASYRTSTDGPWTPIGTQTFASLDGSVQVGLAVSSHVDGTRATAVFDHVSVAAPTGVVSTTAQGR